MSKRAMWAAVAAAAARVMMGADCEAGNGAEGR